MRYVFVICLAAAGPARKSAAARAVAAIVRVICASEGTDPATRPLRAAPGEALEPVVGDRLERRREVEELAVARADPGIAVEHAQAHGPDLAVRGLTPQARAAGRAEDLRVAVGRLPHPEGLRAREQPQRVRRHEALDRGGATGAPLAAPAMAVAGADER